MTAARAWTNDVQLRCALDDVLFTARGERIDPLFYPLYLLITDALSLDAAKRLMRLLNSLLKV